MSDRAETVSNESPTTMPTAGPGEGPAPVRRTRKLAPRAALAFAMQNALIFGFIGLITVFTLLRAPNMLTIGNALDVLRLSAPILVVSIPMAFLLIMRQVDLSVGSTAALSATAAGLLFTKHEVSPVVGALTGLGIGAIVGLINGYMVTVTRLSPIIVTLGGLTALRGLALALAPFPLFGFPNGFVQFGAGATFGVPYVVVTAALVVVLGAYILGLSPVGRHVMALGVNDEAAYLAGINVRRTLWSAYLLTGLAAGLAGIMYAAQYNSAPAGAVGVGFELDVLTAVMLGGVAFDGGRGTIRGVVLGVLFLAVLQNGLSLLNVPAAYSLVIKGIALVVAATLDRATQKSLMIARER